MKAKKIGRVVPALTARTQFGQILRRVRTNNERFVVGRRGEPQAVILSYEEYMRNFAEVPDVLKEIRAAAKAKGLDKMTLKEINAEIKAARQARRAKK